MSKVGLTFRWLVVPLSFIAFNPSTMAASFPSADIDQTQSLGKFAIRVDQWLGNLLFNVDFCPGDPDDPKYDICVIDSPTLYDPNTQIGRSNPHAHGSLIDQLRAKVMTGPDQWTEVGDINFALLPNNFQGPKKTEEVHTLITNLKMEAWDGSKNAVKIRNGTDPDIILPDSIGEVESLNEGIFPNGGFPAQSFFDLFVQIDIDIPGLGIKRLHNKKPFLVEDPFLESFPPEVLYVHGVTSNAAEVFDWDSTQRVGWVVLAGHGVGYIKINPQSQLDAVTETELERAEKEFLADYQKEVVEKGEMPIPSNCGPGGEHWIDDCNRPSFDDANNTVAHVLITKGSCSSTQTERLKLKLRGPTKIARWATQDRIIQTEIVSLLLSGEGITLRAGDGYANFHEQSEPTPDGNWSYLFSLGKTVEKADDPTKAESEFKGSFEIEAPLGENGSLITLRGEEACQLRAEIGRIPPLTEQFNCENVPINLVNEAKEPVACLRKLTHALPVTFNQSLSVTPSEKGLTLSWTTGYEENMAGFATYKGVALDGDCSNNQINNFTDVTPLAWKWSGDGEPTESGLKYSVEIDDDNGDSGLCYGLLSTGFDGTWELYTVAVQ